MTEIVRLFSMWRDTRMAVLASVLAAIHAAALVPFKFIQILPGVTDVRPAVALPIVFSLLFGPAAAWGAAIGNTIGDLFGSLGPGSLFGFAGNFLYGYLPYRVWEAWRRKRLDPRSWADWATYLLAVVAASSACALVIGWGVHLLRLYPFTLTAGWILGQNLLMGFVLAPPLLLALSPRVARMRLLYADRNRGEPRGGPAAAGPFPRLASVGVAALSLGGILAGYAAAAGGASDAAVAGAAAPFVALVILVSVLL